MVQATLQSAAKLWGTDNTGATVTLPISYPNANYKALVTHYNGVLPTSVVPLSVGYINAGTFYVSNNSNENPAVFWVTIG